MENKSIKELLDALETNRSDENLAALRKAIWLAAPKGATTIDVSAIANVSFGERDYSVEESLNAHRQNGNTVLVTSSQSQLSKLE